ncbi:MAG: DUF1838 domain-containing protein [Gammaproteobacteria bacterium]|nr:DUF1838 domain-containing protein [Gammaproteobacteria bacterium]MYD01270.1 DUF1838 domain-containing protein [Gammaproteobacteria bacterium]MYI26344.1 DUF1838 domain-containing protein [Gammaproteobacteria bacterium]
MAGSKSHLRIYGTLSRRRLLGLIGMGLVGGSVAAASGALSEEEQRWYRRLVYSGVDDEVIWSILGVKYGREGNSLTPLWNTNTIGFSRIRYPEQGGYRVDTLEVVFYTDLVSGERLESWRNPYTSREVEVIVPAPVAVSSFHAEVGASERTAPGGIRIAESVQPPRTIGGDTWVQVEKRVAVAPEGAEAPIFSSIEFVDYRGRTGDLRSSAPRVDSTLHLEIVSDWLPWMEMGGRAGGLYTRARGTKLYALNEVPAVSRKLLERHFPEIEEDPFGYIGRAL